MQMIMKTLFTAVFLLQMACFCHAQKPSILKNVPKISMLEMIWTVESEDIIFLGSSGDVFYKVLLLEVPATDSESEEVRENVILLAGEYGETPDGKLYDLGTYDSIENLRIDVGTRKITFLSGLDQDTNVVNFDLP